MVQCRRMHLAVQGLPAPWRALPALLGCPTADLSVRTQLQQHVHLSRASLHALLRSMQAQTPLSGTLPGLLQFSCCLCTQALSCAAACLHPLCCALHAATPWHCYLQPVSRAMGHQLWWRLPRAGRLVDAASNAQLSLAGREVFFRRECTRDAEWRLLHAVLLDARTGEQVRWQREGPGAMAGMQHADDHCSVVFSCQVCGEQLAVTLLHAPLLGPLTLGIFSGTLILFPSHRSCQYSRGLCTVAVHAWWRLHAAAVNMSVLPRSSAWPVKLPPEHEVD